MTLGKIFDQLNFFAAASVIDTTALTVFFSENYAKKKLPPADGSDKQVPVKEIHDGWYAGLFCAEFYGQFTAAKTLNITYAVLKAFKGLVILSFALLYLFDYAVGI